jgi:hypothetical protein
MANEIFLLLVLTRIKASLPGNKRISKGNYGRVSIVESFVHNIAEYGHIDENLLIVRDSTLVL